MIKKFRKKDYQLDSRDVIILREKLSEYKSFYHVPIVRPVFIYALYVVSSKSVFYIGKTNDLSKRLGQHKERVFTRKKYDLYKFINFLRDNGDDFEIIALIDVDESEWERFEIEAIRLARESNINIKNISRGGASSPREEQTNKKMSIIMTGRKASDSAKKKMSDAKKGKKPWNAGVHTGQCPSKSKEAREKISQKLKGRTYSEETLHRMSVARIGKVPVNKGKQGMQGKRVQQIDIMTGEVISVYRNVTIASQSLEKKDSGSISACARGNRKTAHGYKWKYVDMEK